MRAREKERLRKQRMTKQVEANARWLAKDKARGVKQVRVRVPIEDEDKIKTIARHFMAQKFGEEK